MGCVTLDGTAGLVESVRVERSAAFVTLAGTIAPSVCTVVLVAKDTVDSGGVA